MPKKESTQHKLDRVRPPRVHITYDVQVGDAIELKELPFVVGVLGDFSGKPVKPLPSLKDKDRKFVEIDRDTFDQVLAGMTPRLALTVDNKLLNNDTKLKVELRFGGVEKSDKGEPVYWGGIEEFEPDKIVQQVKPLRELIEASQRLSDLLSKMDGNDRLQELLLRVVEDTEQQKHLSRALGLDSPDEGGGEKKEDSHE